MKRPPKPQGLTQYVPRDAFAQHAYAACFSISAADNTRRAYWNDTRRWLAFCEDRGVDPAQPPQVAVIAWFEAMKKDGTASKTRARRAAALSSVYDRMRRQRQVDENPFSVENGPERETAVTRNPTPVASPDAVRKVLETCTPDTLEGVRDEAIIRVLWSTGARRASLTTMTRERLRQDRAGGFEATLIGKGNKEVRVLIRGKAAEALKRWIAELERGGLTRGGIWRTQSGAEMTDKHVWRMLRARAKDAGVKERITPHTFRVAFLTFNPAGLEAKQSAAGHADPATTRLYDRTAWKGREAFEKMPEPEDIDE